MNSATGLGESMSSTHISRTLALIEWLLSWVGPSIVSIVTLLTQEQNYSLERFMGTLEPDKEVVEVDLE